MTLVIGIRIGIRIGVGVDLGYDLRLLFLTPLRVSLVGQVLMALDMYPGETFVLLLKASSRTFRYHGLYALDLKSGVALRMVGKGGLRLVFGVCCGSFKINRKKHNCICTFCQNRYLSPREIQQDFVFVLSTTNFCCMAVLFTAMQCMMTTTCTGPETMTENMVAGFFKFSTRSKTMEKVPGLKCFTRMVAAVILEKAHYSKSKSRKNLVAATTTTL